MQITPIKTHKITREDKDIFKILDRYISNLSEKSVVAVTSKIVSITEGRVVKIGEVDKDSLIAQEAELYLPRQGKYDVSLTITQDQLVPSAGIDESNSDGYYILWPQDPQKSANGIRAFLKKRFNLKKVGVIITDSKSAPLRWGVTGMCLAYSGLLPIKNYIGEKDIFGREMQSTKLNVVDSLSSTAVATMGEGAEQTPLAVINDVPFVVFQDRDPTQEEVDNLLIDPDDDLYAPLLQAVKWKKGKK